MKVDDLKRLGAYLEGHFLLSAGGHSDKYIQCAKLMQSRAGRRIVRQALAATDFYSNLYDYPGWKEVWKKWMPDVVIGGAYGGIKFAMLVEDMLSGLVEEKGLVPNIRSIFCERKPEVVAVSNQEYSLLELQILINEGSLSKDITVTARSGNFQLRRGFEINKGEKVLIAEDVTTTGKSIGEVAELVKEHGGEIVGAISIIDRRGESELKSVKIKPGLDRDELGYWTQDPSSGVDLVRTIKPFISLIQFDINTWKPEECPMCGCGNCKRFDPTDDCFKLGKHPHKPEKYGKDCGDWQPKIPLVKPGSSSK